MRGRGLKYRGNVLKYIMRMVAPHAGAWIEMAIRNAMLNIVIVAPHAGAWIEICGLSSSSL